MKHIGIAILASLLMFGTAHAAGWSSVHKYVKKSGNCAGQEVLASQHRGGTHVADRDDADGDQSEERPLDHGPHQRHRTLGHRV